MGRRRFELPTPRLSGQDNYDTDELLQSFKRFCEVITKDNVRSFLSQYNDNSPRTYRYILCGLTVFFRDFLDAGYLVDTFKFPYIPFEFKWIPRHEELKKFYQSLKTDKARALFLVYASSGLEEAKCFH